MGWHGNPLAQDYLDQPLLDSRLLFFYIFSFSPPFRQVEHGSSSGRWGSLRECFPRHCPRATNPCLSLSMSPISPEIFCQYDIRKRFPRQCPRATNQPFPPFAPVTNFSWKYSVNMISAKDARVLLTNPCRSKTLPCHQPISPLPFHTMITLSLLFKTDVPSKSSS